MKLGLLGWCLAVMGVLGCGPSLAQQPVKTIPYESTTQGGNVSSTITLTNTFQQLWAANTLRKGCTFQNNGLNNMWVEEGVATGSAVKTNSVVVAPGVVYSCTKSGVVLQGAIQVTGTSGDAFYAAQY